MSTDLRLLSVRQPHAWAICSGYKDVENRTWRFPYEMPCTIGIQAGVRPDPDGLDAPVRGDVPDDLPRGCTLGVVDVVSDHDSSECIRPDGTLCSPWAVPGNWVLANPRMLDDPIPCRGFLNMFRPPQDVADALGGLLRLR